VMIYATKTSKTH